MKRSKKTKQVPKISLVKLPNLKPILIGLVIFAILLILVLNSPIYQILINQLIKNAPSQTTRNLISKEVILKSINDLRIKNKLKPLSENQKLNNASLIRAEALSQFQDWGALAATGSGVTRENTTSAVGLKYLAIGNLEFGFYKDQKIDDAIKFWMQSKEGKETLLDPDLNEIGIALKDAKISGADVKIASVILIQKSLGETNSTQVVQPQPPQQTGNLTWTGPELFEEVNKARISHGVNAMGTNDLLCSIASARIHQLLERGYQDGHKGFQEMYSDKNSPYYYIFEKYNISEYLVFSNKGPKDAVEQWEGTLTHRTLLTGGQYTMGCTSAFSGIGVAIAGY